MFALQEYSGPGIGLHDELQDYLNGVSMRDLPNLREWVGGLRLLRVAERETEAQFVFDNLCAVLSVFLVTSHVVGLFICCVVFWATA